MLPSTCYGVSASFFCLPSLLLPCISPHPLHCPRFGSATYSALASNTCAAVHGDVNSKDDWRRRSKPIRPGSVYPAKDHCSQCGLCDTYYIAHVKSACAFLGEGMSRTEALEPKVHGRGRDLNSLDDLYFGVHDEMLYAKRIDPVDALRAVEQYLGLEKLYVLGTNCVDNGSRKGLDKFLRVASTDPETVLHYEFMQDYKVHLKHLDGQIEEVPYFCLPADELTDVIAPSCYSCFDYTNALADLVVGYMGVPKYAGVKMSQHPQYITIRNKRGKEMLDAICHLVDITPTVSSGDRRPFVMETVKADHKAKLGQEKTKPAPRIIGSLIAFFLNLVGPKGLEFGRYSLDYHSIRNFLHVHKAWGKQRAELHIPSYSKKLVAMYNKEGYIDKLLSENFN
eukprot:c19968_g1_i1 orf=208-1395(-)